MKKALLAVTAMGLALAFPMTAFASDAKTITITWAESDSTQVDVMENYVKPALAEAFPDINFEYTGITTDKAEALKTMSATDSLTDIFCSDSGVYDTLLAGGDFLNLAEPLSADGWLDENYRNPSMLFNGDDLYNITCGQDNYYTPVIYYNTEIFDSLGLSEPQTMDEFLEICQTLKDNDIYPLTTDVEFTRYFMMDALISSYDPEALNDLHARNCDWTDERIVNALKVFDQLKQMDAFTPDSSVKGDSDCMAEFANGTAAMWPTMSWFNFNVAEGEVDFTTGEFNWPSGNENYPTNYQQLNWGTIYGGWAVNGHSEDPETAIEVLKVILKAEATRHADNGISENFIIEGAAEPTNPLEIERMEEYNNATEYRTLLIITGMDAATNSDYATDLSMLLSDDQSYLTENFINDFNDSWLMNTRAAD